MTTPTNDEIRKAISVYELLGAKRDTLLVILSAAKELLVARESDVQWKLVAERNISKVNTLEQQLASLKEELARAQACRNSNADDKDKARNERDALKQELDKERIKNDGCTCEKSLSKQLTRLENFPREMEGK